MSGSIIRLGNEHIAARSIIHWLIQIADRDKFLLYGPQQVQAGLDLRVRIAGLHSGAHNRQKPSIACHLVSV
ncbi:hypothetical protein BpHYR1_006172 [Brachionus plicatilis]|uniref:Uncharacterized protein n=1 Tax=Brachionus plicatilis TaxID=10195 RepID=A0A3M7T5U4_BRAPC|nr:hypothetical protein BpHYR1_006172 [Brachionus plicatilis]